MNINPGALSVWIAATAITYGITGNVQNTALALGVAAAISSVATLLSD